MAKPSKVGRRDETGGIKGSRSWSEGRSGGRYGWQVEVESTNQSGRGEGGGEKFGKQTSSPGRRRGQRSGSAKWTMSLELMGATMWASLGEDDGSGDVV